ncbi:WYL domain-containing protein [Pseudoalteromonas sp. MM17-2]|uniref:WYL domain-containing protein n=1 Tax=Pseudoalteromonas sp. MM17-2 TaxID=2917753 RepID=UPI001EF56AE8|nr:WYL domain-containing protein [Pseudoalteromonas sp. MM17-2]MCG7545944.1 WYL domain-containing protein [Pseudoalteromonas sp. MM17-2]
MISLRHLPSAQVSRLTYIEFCLRFLGSFSRADLVKKFGIGTAAASRDIAEYKKLMPNNISDTSSSKNYVLSEQWEPLFNFKSSEVLAQLTGREIQSFSHSYISNEILDIIDEPDLNIVTEITKTILSQRVIETEYFSNSSGISTKTLVPHSYMYNGSRWHVRAFDRNKNRFGDFVISRFLSAKIIEKEAPNTLERKAEDIQWNRIIDLEIIPHPSLEDTRGVINEFNMVEGVLKKRIRASSAGYFLKSLYVDCARVPTEDKHFRLRLKNRLSLYGVEGLNMAPYFDGFEEE